jgi:hypothetical protein
MVNCGKGMEKAGPSRRADGVGMNKAGPSRRADGVRWRYAMGRSVRVAQDDMRAFLLKERKE